MDDSSVQVLQVLKLSTGEVTSCDLNINHVLAIGSSDKLVRVMEWKTGLGFVDKNYSPMSCHKYGVTSVKFSPKGTMLASSSLDGTAVVFDVFTGDKIYTVVQYSAISIKYCEFTPDSTKLITVGDDATCCFWNLFQRCQIRHFQLFENEFNMKGLSVSADSQYLISVCSEGLFGLWLIDDISTNEPRNLFMKRDTHDVISSCDFSPVRQVAGDGQLLRFTYRVATSGTEGLVKLWEIIIKRSQAPDNFECDLLLLHSLKGHDNDVYSVRFNSSGHCLASAGLDGYVNLWQVNTGDNTAKLRGHTKLVTCSVFSKDSIVLVTGSSDKRVIIWDLTQGLTLDSSFSKPCNVSSHFSNFDLISYNSENEAGNHAEKLDEFDISQILKLPSIVHAVHLSSNDLLAVAGGEKTISVWRKRTSAFVEEVKLEGHKYSVNYLEISPCGSKLISCSVSGEALFWDLGMNLSCKMSYPHRIGGLRTCRFSPNSKFIAAGGDNQEVYLWDATNLELLGTLEQCDNAITSVAFTPDSKFLVSVCSGGNITMYDVETGDIRAVKRNAHDLGVLCCDLSSLTSPDERSSSYEEYLLATCGNDPFVKLWEAKSSGINIAETFTGHRGAVIHVKFSSKDRNILASCSSDTTIRIWSTRIKQCLHTLNGHNSAVTTCSFSQDSSLIASGSLDKTVLIWRLMEGSRPQIQQLSSSFNKPLENWTATDIINWFTSINCPDMADKIKIKPFQGKTLLCNGDESLATFLGLEDENDKEELKEKFQWLRTESSYNACDSHFSEKVPHKYLCPITHQIMKNPVICSDGFTYDQDAITEWFIGGRFTSPVTRECLTSTKLLPNLTLKRIIYKFLFENVKA